MEPVGPQPPGAPRPVACGSSEGGHSSAAFRRRQRRRCARERARRGDSSAARHGPWQQRQPPRRRWRPPALTAAEPAEPWRHAPAAGPQAAAQECCGARIPEAPCLRGAVWRLSRDQAGCRLVQDALALAPPKVAAALVAELHGHVAEAIRSPHANFVIQRVIEVLPTEVAGFIVTEIRGVGAVEVAADRFGCRVLCRLLEHFSAADARAAPLVDEVVAESRRLCQHTFGHFVLEAVLEHGSEGQRHGVVAALQADVLSLCRSRNSSFVIEKALTYASPEDRRALAAALGGRRLPALLGTAAGCHVARALARLPLAAGVDAGQIRSRLSSLAEERRWTRHGAALLEDLRLEGGPQP